jgi:hypothetical protein
MQRQWMPVPSSHRHLFSFDEGLFDRMKFGEKSRVKTGGESVASVALARRQWS